MKRAILFLLLLLFLFGGMEEKSFCQKEEPLLILDFQNGTKWVPVQKEGNSGGINGILPEGWAEGSSPDGSTIRYSRETEEKLKFWRIRASVADGKNCRFYCRLPVIRENGYYRLRLKVRGSGIKIHYDLRQNQAPRKFLREYSYYSTPEWANLEYLIPLKKNETPLRFEISLGETGTLDLARLEIVRLTKLEYHQIVADQHPDGTPKNLAEQTCFPLGLPSGSMIDKFFSLPEDLEIETDRNLSGPSGAPALHLKLHHGMMTTYGYEAMASIILPPFPIIDFFQSHVVSLYIRGTGAGSLAVIKERNQLVVKREFAVSSPDWTRIQLPFTPDPASAIHAAKITFRGEIWIDAYQIETGTRATAYESPSRCEVALACQSGELAASCIQFTDEPDIIRYAITGSTTNRPVLAGKVINLYGEEKSFAYPLTTGSKLQYGQIKYDLFTEKPLGSFRIEAWVEDTGERISPITELVMNRIRRPHYWGKEAPDSPFGTLVNPVTRHLAMAKAIGINWVRLHDAGIQLNGWSYLEPEPEKWVFYDEQLDRYHQMNLNILGQIGTAPLWASFGSKSTRNPFPASVTTNYFLPLCTTDFRSYAEKLVSHYQQKINCYTVWNEPWSPLFFHTDLVNKLPEGQPYASFDNAYYIAPEKSWNTFFNLQKTAFEITAAHHVRLGGFNSTGSVGKEGRVDGSKWNHQLNALNALDYCDFVDYHHYIQEKAGFPEDACSKTIQRLFGELRDRQENYTKPIWLSEGSPFKADSYLGLYKYTLPYSNYENEWEISDRLCRFVLSLLSNRVSKIFLYSMGTYSYFDTPSNSIFLSADGSLHPAAIAFSNLAWHLEDCNFLMVQNVKPNVFAYVFKHKEGGFSLVLSTMAGEIPVYRLPVMNHVVITDLFGNPESRHTIDTGRLIFIRGLSNEKMLNAFLKSIN